MLKFHQVTKHDLQLSHALQSRRTLLATAFKDTPQGSGERFWKGIPRKSFASAAEIPIKQGPKSCVKFSEPIYGTFVLLGPQVTAWQGVSLYNGCSQSVASYP